jgi:glycosyltransferase involved in cell wall biosynthesis
VEDLNVLVAIPAFNAEKTLPRLVAQLKEIPQVSSVLVVDDGSSDDTAEVARKSGATVISFRTNFGKGASLKTAFRYAIAKSYDYLITMDADLQHEISTIPAMIETVVEEGVDLVIGSRRKDSEAMPFDRLLSNRLTSIVTSLLCNRLVEDSQCGFRVLKVKALESLKLDCDKFDLETEILIRASRYGFKITSHPIPSVYSSKGKSHVNRFVDTCRFLRLMWKSFWW